MHGLLGKTAVGSSRYESKVHQYLNSEMKDLKETCRTILHMPQQCEIHLEKVFGFSSMLAGK